MLKLQGHGGCVWLVAPVGGGTCTTGGGPGRGEFPPFLSEKGTFCVWAAGANSMDYPEQMLVSWELGFGLCWAVMACEPLRPLNSQARVSFPGRRT